MDSKYKNLGAYSLNVKFPVANKVISMVVITLEKNKSFISKITLLAYMHNALLEFCLRTGLYQRSCAIRLARLLLGWVTICGRKPSWHVASHLDQLSLPSPRVDKSSTSLYDRG